MSCEIKDENPGKVGESEKGIWAPHSDSFW